MANRSEQSGPPYSEAQATEWMGWLARNMQQHGQSVFLIEHLQPSWLDTRSQRWANLLAYSVLFGFFIAVILYQTWDVAAKLDAKTIAFPGDAMPTFVLLWIAATLWSFFVSVVDMQQQARQSSTISKGVIHWYKSIAGHFLLFCIAWGLIWLGVWSVSFFVVESTLEGFFVDNVQRHPLLGGLVFVIVYMGRVGKQYIGTVEALGFSLKRAVVWGLAGLGLGLVVLLLYWALSPGKYFEDIKQNLELYLPLGLAAGFLLGLLVFRIQEQKTRPNQGIWLSLRSMWQAGALIGAIMSLVFWLIFEYGPLEQGPANAVQGTIVFGLTALVGAMLWYGGFDALRHFVLRAVLGISGQFPLRIARFLDYTANELSFLQKVGGGYMFIHRYLLEHFAAMEPRPHSHPEHKTAT